MKTVLAAVAACVMAAGVVADEDPVWVKVAASDSSARAKGAAEFVCAGTNDQETIQKAIDLCAKDGRSVFLFNGCYCLDAVREIGDGGPKAAVVFPILQRELKFVGESVPMTGYRTSFTNRNGVVIRARSGVFANADGKSVDFLRGGWTPRGIQNGSALTISNMRVFAPDALHAYRCIDLRRVDRVVMKSVSMVGMGDRVFAGDHYPWTDRRFGPLPVPVIDAIGLTMTDGSNLAVSTFDNVFANGFGQGIQAGGEHVVCTECGATFGLYGWTFGNYEFSCGFNHPITLINCLDEQNVNLPLFADCGDHDGKGNLIHGRQEVTMISFNCERVLGHTPGKKVGDDMRETKPGTWCGYIGFTRQPDWCAINSVDLPIWKEDGSGSGFRTENMCHKRICSSAERRSYYPQLAQQIFDTDLKKLVICIDVKNRVWVDAHGNKVD